ncbi:EpsG family protein [Candidatus Williamhamiltonella defendens]|uniref:EpsG family protein n=1 Tax=Candidatus Williamhamiltonella defendens TaxID=138072 RepID=UPI001581F337|nr:EpsG family protein [Candidatus Hamiltonella defensa]
MLIIPFILILTSLSPIASVFSCVFISLFFPNIKNKGWILFVLFILSFNLSVIYSSKCFYDGSSDFGIYYTFYQNILSKKSEGLIHLLLTDVYHFEPLYCIFNVIIAFIFGRLTEVQYSILLNFISIYSICISTLIYSSKFTINNFLFLIIFSIFISKIGSITLFWRQSLATVFVILFLQKKNLKKYIYLTIATGFHMSSLYVGPLCYFILNFNLKRNKLIYVILIVTAIIWPIFGKNILLHIVNIVGISENSFFVNNYDYPYFLDTLKTIYFSIPIIIFYKLQKLNAQKDPIYYLLVLEVLILLAFGTIPHFFRIIYPIAVVIIYLHTVLVLIKLNKYFFILSFLFILVSNFFRFTSDKFLLQFPQYSLAPFYYFKI